MLFISLAIAGFAFALDVLQPPDEAKVRKLLARARVESIDKLADGKVAAINGRVAVGEDGEVRAPLSGRVEHVFPRTEFTPRFLFSDDERPNLVLRVRVRIEDPRHLLHAGLPVFVQLAGGTR